MHEDTFDPFALSLDKHIALNLLQTATQGADDGELFFERRRSETLVLDYQRIKTANFDASEGFGLRAVRGEKIGYGHSSEISEAAIKRATGTVALAVADKGGQWADAPQRSNNSLYASFDPTSEIGFAQKVDILKQIDAYLRALDKRVVQVSAVIAASLQEVVIMRPDGEVFTDLRPMTRVNISVILENNGRRESGSAGGGGRFSLSELIRPEDWQPKAREALRIAAVNLDAIAAPAGMMDVVLGPGWPGILLH